MQLSAQSIELRYGSHIVLESFSHTFRSGGWTHIIGPNGAGKSTLLKALCGLQPTAGGQIRIDQRRIDQISPAERAHFLSYVPQQIESLPPITATDLVSHGLYAADLPQKQTEARAQQVMHDLNIAHLGNRRITELSGGELQLCLIAAAIAQDTAILLLDEPSKGLDIRYQLQLVQILDGLRRQGRTIISVTHDLSAAKKYADQTILLANHRCIFQADGFPSPQQLGQAYEVSEFDPPQMPVITISEGRTNSNGQKATGSAQGALERSPDQVKYIRWLLVSIIIALICLTICPFIGATAASPESNIFWMLRIPRVIWGAAAGAVLAVVGASFQALFQIPLATPYTLGVASGASLGAMAAIQLGIAGIAGLSVSACGGGILTMFAVIAIASRYGLRHPFYCLMAGVAAAMFCSAIGMMIQSFATPLTAQQMMRWQLGGFEIVGYDSMFCLIPIAIGIVGLLLLAHPLNLISVDNDLAITQGVQVRRTRFLAMLAAGIITSIVVSICGPIGFVGLIIPNGMRQLVGADLRRLLPVSALFGTSFLVIADTISRILERMAWIPVGVVTAIVGVPCFIYILFGCRKR